MKIIVDTNIIFSAILNSNSRIGWILLNSKNHFQFFTCYYLRLEIQKHRNKLLKLTHISDEELDELINLVTHKITFINENIIPKKTLIKAEDQLQGIDPNDTVFVALTKHINGILWTGDIKLYNGLKARKFKKIMLTEELNQLLERLKLDQTDL
jgi:predicted nucleic acid-binding protein